MAKEGEKKILPRVPNELQEKGNGRLGEKKESSSNTNNFTERRNSIKNLRDAFVCRFY